MSRRRINGVRECAVRGAWGVTNAGWRHTVTIMGLHCVLYMSSATREMTPDEIDRLLDGARQRNQARGVTGALLHYGGRFVQVLEGEPAAVDHCFEQIRRDPRHQGITRLHAGPIPASRFPGWSMRYVSTHGAPDRAVSEFLDQLQKEPTPAAIDQAIQLLRRLASGAARWQAR